MSIWASSWLGQCHRPWVGIILAFIDLEQVNNTLTTVTKYIMLRQQPVNIMLIVTLASPENNFSLTLEYVTKRSSPIQCCIGVGNEFGNLSTCVMNWRFVPNCKMRLGACLQITKKMTSYLKSGPGLKIAQKCTTEQNGDIFKKLSKN